jgi:hypothetical protein
MKKGITFSLIAFACAIAAPGFAFAATTCPPTIAVAQSASTADPAWTVTYSGYNTALSGVTIFDGPPANQASLLPDSEEKTSFSVFQAWKLGSSNNGYWLQCNYAHTTAQLSKQLPPGVSRCEVSYDANVAFGGGGGHVVKSVKCK